MCASLLFLLICYPFSVHIRCCLFSCYINGYRLPQVFVGMLLSVYGSRFACIRVIVVDFCDCKQYHFSFISPLSVLPVYLVHEIDQGNNAMWRARDSLR